MEKHTPTPWKAAPFSSVVGCPIMAQPDTTKNSILVASTRGAVAEDPAGFRAEVEANAAFIVRACNSHNALVAALENLLSAHSDVADSMGLTGPITGRLQNAAEQARAALKAAKEV